MKIAHKYLIIGAILMSSAIGIAVIITIGIVGYNYLHQDKGEVSSEGQDDTSSASSDSDYSYLQTANCPRCNAEVPVGQFACINCRKRGKLYYPSMNAKKLLGVKCANCLNILFLPCPKCRYTNDPKIAPCYEKP